MGRVESALQERGDPEFAKDGIGEENARIKRNLQGLLQAAELFHSSASVILSDGARSTVWGGSVTGEPLTGEQHRNIQDWIPPPVVEEHEHARPRLQPVGVALRVESKEEDGIHPGANSDAESDGIERQLTKKFEELAGKSLEQRNYEKAEIFLRKLIDRSADDETLSTALTKTNTWLAYACFCQGKWREAERILVPIAMTKGLVSEMAFRGLHALAIDRLAAEDYDTAIRYCKRAAWGMQTLWDNSCGAFHESMALLARIYEAKGDLAEAEACSSFLPADYASFIHSRPASYIEAFWFYFLPFYTEPVFEDRRITSGISSYTISQKGALNTSNEASATRSAPDIERDKNVEAKEERKREKKEKPPESRSTSPKRNSYIFGSGCGQMAKEAAPTEPETTEPVFTLLDGPPVDAATIAPVAVAAAAMGKEPETKTEEKAEAKQEKKEEEKEEKARKSRSASRRRNSIFGNFGPESKKDGPAESNEEEKEEEKEEKARKRRSTSRRRNSIFGNFGPGSKKDETTDSKVEEKEEEKEEKTRMRRSTSRRRNSIFGNLGPGSKKDETTDSKVEEKEEEKEEKARMRRSTSRRRNSLFGNFGPESKKDEPAESEGKKVEAKEATPAATAEPVDAPLVARPGIFIGLRN